MQKKNSGKLKKKVILEKKRRKKQKKRESWKKKEKKKRSGLWITVVIHSAFECGETVISSHHLDVCIMCLFYSFLNHLNFFFMSSRCFGFY
jgi:hypothetical protein